MGGPFVWKFWIFAWQTGASSINNPVTIGDDGWLWRRCYGRLWWRVIPISDWR